METNICSTSSGGSNVTVFLCKDERKIECASSNVLSAEDLCLTIAKSLKLRPISFHLFALCIRKSSRPSSSSSSNTISIWLPPCFKFNSTQNYHVDFRLRFKLPSLISLSRLDEIAFDYLFHQMRYDLLNGIIPEICTDDNKSEVLGLCITDMLRVIKENDINREEIENNYRQFIPKPIYKQHMFFLKKRIHETLSHLLNVQDKSHNVKYIKEQYVSHIEELAPSYLTEEFYIVTFKEEEYPATIRVDPFHINYRGLSIANIGKNNWEHLCTIEDLCFISMRGDHTAEISRKNGIPISCKFKTMELVQSFVSLLDGHYRLTEKWTFNLCKDLFTPSLIKLKMIKCHGPIGEKFSYKKLSSHLNTKKGTFILRQSSTNLEEFSIDFILENKNRVQTKEIRRSSDGNYFIDGNPKMTYVTVAELILHFSKNPEPDFLIKECLPPSEYDLSPLLVCRSPKLIRDTGLEKSNEEKENTNFGSVNTISSAPQIISARSLQVFRGRKYEYSGNTCKVVKAVWKQSKTLNFNVAIKFLKKENEQRLMKEFLEIADHCVLWQCESLVSLKGIVLGNPHALVLDWMAYGPLDIYLRENSLHVETVELIEAASHIAKALWFLEDHGIVHGNIRCHNVMVSEHSDSGLIVKLADPSIIENVCFDIHWIPPELYDKPNLVKNFTSSDVWAVGTTLWEIFSYGIKPPQDLQPTVYKAKYQTGWRLPRPDKCPIEIQRIITECWSQTPMTRKQPQALVRDIHQILYQLIGSKRVHSYETVSLNSSEGSHSRDNNAFDISSSDNFNWATFGSDMNTSNVQDSADGTVSTFVQDSVSNLSRATQCTWLFQNASSPSPDLISGFSEFYMNGSIATIYTMGSARGIYEFGKEQVTLGRMIGQGCYGAVFMGELVRSDGFKEPVAVKMMKENENIPDKENLDFQREFEILQKLSHQNIVEVKGVVHDPSLLLIMEYLPMGSLLDYFRMSYTKPGLKQLVKFAQDVADGMEYLSEYNIVHRDLAARNLLVANDDLIKISDFGLARFTDNDNCYTFRTDRKLPIKWYPPESLQLCKFSEQSDIWSYGVTIYEIFSHGDDPILPGMNGIDDDLDEMLDFLNKGIRLPCPQSCPQIIYTHLMLPCWQLNPKLRPTFRKLVGDVREVESQLF